MPIVLPLLLATSLTAGVASPEAMTISPSFLKDTISLNRQNGTDVFTPPTNSGWDGSFAETDGYDYPRNGNEQYETATPLVDTIRKDFRESSHWKTSLDASLNPSRFSSNDRDTITSSEPHKFGEEKTGEDGNTYESCVVCGYTRRVFYWRIEP